MKCNKCGFESENGKFCPNCGNVLSSVDNQKYIKEEKKIICNKCGFENEGNNKFCATCSNPLQTKASDNLDLSKNEESSDNENKNIGSDINKNTAKTENSNSSENKTIKCNKCGHENPIDSLYCSKCSKKLKKDKKKKSKLKVVIPSIIAIILVLVGIIGFIITMLNRPYSIIDDIQKGSKTFKQQGITIELPNTWEEVYWGSEDKYYYTFNDGDEEIELVLNGTFNPFSSDTYEFACNYVFSTNKNDSTTENLKEEYLSDNLYKISCFKTDSDKYFYRYHIYNKNTSTMADIYIYATEKLNDEEGFDYIMQNVQF